MISIMGEITEIPVYDSRIFSLQMGKDQRPVRRMWIKEICRDMWATAKIVKELFEGLSCQNTALLQFILFPRLNIPQHISNRIKDCLNVLYADDSIQIDSQLFCKCRFCLM